MARNNPVIIGITNVVSIIIIIIAVGGGAGRSRVVGAVEQLVRACCAAVPRCLNDSARVRRPGGSFTSRPDGRTIAITTTTTTGTSTSTTTAMTVEATIVTGAIATIAVCEVDASAV